MTQPILDQQFGRFWRRLGDALGDEQNALLAFMAGATIIVELTRRSMKEGGAEAASKTLNDLGRETDAFLVAVVKMAEDLDKGKPEP